MISYSDKIMPSAQTTTPSALERVAKAKELRDQDIGMATTNANEYLYAEIEKALEQESMAAIAEALEWSRTYIYQFMRENR